MMMYSPIHILNSVRCSKVGCAKAKSTNQGWDTLLLDKAKHSPDSAQHAQGKIKVDLHMHVCGAVLRSSTTMRTCILMPAHPMASCDGISSKKHLIVDNEAHALITWPVGAMTDVVKP